MRSQMYENEGKIEHNRDVVVIVTGDSSRAVVVVTLQRVKKVK